MVHSVLLHSNMKIKNSTIEQIKYVTNNLKELEENDTFNDKHSKDLSVWRRRFTTLVKIL